MLADSKTEAYAARCMIVDAARKRDEGRDITVEASASKLFATEMVGRVADRAVQAGRESGLVTAVAPKPDQAQLRPDPAHALQGRGAAVNASVVNGHHLVRLADPVQHRPEAFDEDREYLLLIEDGDDDGEQR